MTKKNPMKNGNIVCAKPHWIEFKMWNKILDWKRKISKIKQPSHASFLSHRTHTPDKKEYTGTCDLQIVGFYILIHYWHTCKWPLFTCVKTWVSGDKCGLLWFSKNYACILNTCRTSRATCEGYMAYMWMLPWKHNTSPL